MLVAERLSHRVVPGKACGLCRLAEAVNELGRAQDGGRALVSSADGREEEAGPGATGRRTGPKASIGGPGFDAPIAYASCCGARTHAETCGSLPASNEVIEARFGGKARSLKEDNQPTQATCGFPAPEGCGPATRRATRSLLRTR